MVAAGDRGGPNPPSGEQEGSCPPKAIHITDKEKVQKLLISALLLQLVGFAFTKELT